LDEARANFGRGTSTRTRGIGRPEREGEQTLAESVPKNAEVAGGKLEALGDDACRQTLEEPGAKRLIGTLPIGGRGAEVARRVDIR
jgi:hypothetical protein